MLEFRRSGHSPDVGQGSLFQRVNALSVVHSLTVTVLLASPSLCGAVTAGSAGFLPFRLFGVIGAGSGIPSTKLSVHYSWDARRQEKRMVPAERKKAPPPRPSGGRKSR